jgi:hypothetical protein
LLVSVVCFHNFQHPLEAQGDEEKIYKIKWYYSGRLPTVRVGIKHETQGWPETHRPILPCIGMMDTDVPARTVTHCPAQWSMDGAPKALFSFQKFAKIFKISRHIESLTCVRRIKYRKKK